MNMDMKTYLTTIVGEYNSDPNHPSLSVFEKTGLDAIRNIEKMATDLDAKIKETVEDMNKKDNQLKELQIQMLQLRAKSEGIQELLYKAASSAT